jgi:hypothetical protein
MSDLQPFKVFNMLNNSSCMKVLDFRCPEQFESNRIRRSLTMSTENMTHTKEKILDLVRAQRGLFGLLLLYGEATDMSALDHLQEFIAAEYDHATQASEETPDEKLTVNLHRLEYVHAASFELFQNKYRACAQLYEGPGTHPYVGCNYFASEIIPDFLFLGECLPACSALLSMNIFGYFHSGTYNAIPSLWALFANE